MLTGCDHEACESRRCQAATAWVFCIGVALASVGAGMIASGR